MEFSTAAKTKSSSNLASIHGNDDCLELTWQNGQVIAQGVSSSTSQKMPNANPFKKPRNSPMLDFGKVNFSNFTRHTVIAAAAVAPDDSVVMDSSGGSGGLVGPKGKKNSSTSGASNSVSFVARSLELPCKKSEAVVDHCYNQASSSAVLRAKWKADTSFSNVLPLVESSVVCSFGASNNMDVCSREQEAIDDSTRLSDNDEETEGVVKEKHAREGTRVKRSRNTEIHNFSERKRRDKINKKLRVLKDLVPNCNKVDIASMLDDAIEYLKTLQLKLQIMSMGTGLCMPRMMLPTGPHQMVNTSHLPQLMGAGMGFRPATTIPCNLPQFPFRPLPGITDNRVGMFGFPNQLTHMPMLHAPFIPMVGMPATQPLQPTCNATNLAENLASAQLNTPMVSAPNYSVSQAQSAIKQAQNQGFLHQ